ncbi:hypothetical protein BOX15_Mlig002633g1 [Macrostomum lignano]|uniref:Uncharacterized protein n=1 Tax=Macrostomum lignano TaxID=282301 RepID=A0A267DL81_9PLAT|nr:hypothetical protein BOX15_Mlig002633g1 [Macrostomum lignano]
MDTASSIENANRSSADTTLQPIIATTTDWRQVGGGNGNQENIQRGKFVDSVFGRLPDVTVSTIAIVAAVCGAIIGTLLIALICVCHRRRRLLVVAKATNNNNSRSHGRHRRRQSGHSSLVTGLPGSSSDSPCADAEDGADADGVADTTFATTVSGGAFSPRLAEMGALLPAASAGGRQPVKSTFGPPLTRTATVGNNGTAAATSAVSSASTLVELRQKKQQQQQQQAKPGNQATTSAAASSEAGGHNDTTRGKFTYEIVV